LTTTSTASSAAALTKPSRIVRLLHALEEIP